MGGAAGAGGVARGGSSRVARDVNTLAFGVIA